MHKNSLQAAIIDDVDQVNKSPKRTGKGTLRPLTAALSVLCAGVMAFSTIAPATAGTAAPGEGIPLEEQEAQIAHAESIIEEAKTADPQGFEERLATIEGTPALNDVLNQLPEGEAEQEREALAAMFDDPEALQETLNLYQSGSFVPYLDANGVLQVEVDQDRLFEFTQAQASNDASERDGEFSTRSSPIALPECAAAWGAAIGFIAARYPSCAALIPLSRVAAATCAAVNFAADQVIDWNAACD